jgi:hypothetical protein
MFCPKVVSGPRITQDSAQIADDNQVSCGASLLQKLYRFSLANSRSCLAQRSIGVVRADNVYRSVIWGGAGTRPGWYLDDNVC